MYNCALLKYFYHTTVTFPLPDEPSSAFRNFFSYIYIYTLLFVLSTARTFDFHFTLEFILASFKIYNFEILSDRYMNSFICIYVLMTLLCFFFFFFFLACSFLQYAQCEEIRPAIYATKRLPAIRRLKFITEAIRRRDHINVPSVIEDFRPR